MEVPMLLALWTALLSLPAPATECGGGSCAPNPVTTEAFVTWSAPTRVAIPPIDQRPAAHLRVATFALG